jgi:molybdate transport system permease protein
VWAGTGRDSGTPVAPAPADAGTAPQVAADLTPAAVAELALVPGEQLWFVVKAAEVSVLLR